MAYRAEPKDRSGAVDRFRSRLVRLFGRNYRLVWDGQHGQVAPPGRWVIQERGHRAGRWQYVWAIQSGSGEYRDVGDWAFQRLHSMDMSMCHTAMSGQTGSRQAWTKVKSWIDGPRKRRAVAALVDWHRRYREEILPRALKRASKMGQIIRPGGLDPEQSVRMAAVGHPGSAREQERLHVEELAIAGEGIIPARAPMVFGSMTDKPLAQHQKHVRQRRRRKGRL